MQAVEGLKHLDDVKLQQHNQVQDFVIPKFEPPFYHKRNPLETEADRAAQQWFHHYFGNTTILETFHNIKKDTTQTIPVAVHPTAELSRLERKTSANISMMKLNANQPRIFLKKYLHKFRTLRYVTPNFDFLKYSIN
jgi:hypothetical protein